ncbi:MAG: hypothetical protein RR573_10650 [Oscillospiraceae bacterium]
MKTFNSLEEIKPYYNEKTDTYEFVEDGDLFDVYFRFDMKIISHIKARDINARNIDVWDINAQNINACDIYAQNINACDIYAQDIYAWDINALDIKAWNINARDISYWAVCFAQFTFKCKSIVGKRKNAKHFCLDSKIVVAE